MNNLKVSCYSGYTYAERPESFEWRGVEYEIKEIEKEWQEVLKFEETADTVKSLLAKLVAEKTQQDKQRIIDLLNRDECVTTM